MNDRTELAAAILEHLAEHGDSTIEELSLSMETGIRNVRHIVMKLYAQGDVTRRIMLRGRGGRPAMAYSVGEGGEGAPPAADVAAIIKSAMKTRTPLERAWIGEAV